MSQTVQQTPPPSASVSSAPNAAIDVRGLHKRYRAASVLQDVSLQVRPGEVYALTGPNGAGKTTLIRCMTGLAFPTAGSVALLGHDVHQEGRLARAHLGAVVEAPAKFYPQFSGTQNLTMHARLTQMAPAAAQQGRKVSRERIREVLAQLELTHMAARPVGHYSLGQRQRLGVAAAILGHPKALILDEPTSGLDALGIGLIHRLVTQLAASGCAVILSTHHLREIATYAHTVGILSGGRMVDSIDLRGRRAAYRFRLHSPQAAAAALAHLPNVSQVSVRAPYVVAHLSSEAQVSRVISALLSQGFEVLEASPDHFDLYEYYRERVE